MTNKIRTQIVNSIAYAACNKYGTTIHLSSSVSTGVFYYDGYIVVKGDGEIKVSRAKKAGGDYDEEITLSPAQPRGNIHNYVEAIEDFLRIQ